MHVDIAFFDPPLVAVPWAAEADSIITSWKALCEDATASDGEDVVQAVTVLAVLRDYMAVIVDGSRRRLIVTPGAQKIGSVPIFARTVPTSYPVEWDMNAAKIVGSVQNLAGQMVCLEGGREVTPETAVGAMKHFLAHHGLGDARSLPGSTRVNEAYSPRKQ